MYQRNIRLYCRNSLILSILLPVTFLAVSCEKEPEPLTKNSVITGRTGLFGEYEYNPSLDIRVVASGPYGNITVFADEWFTIPELGNGTYSLEYSKEGYGTIRQYGIQLFGNDTVRAEEIRLFEKPDIYLDAPEFLSAYPGTHPFFGSGDTTAICIETSFAYVGRYGLPLLLFMDTDPDVSCDDYRFVCPGNEAALNEGNQVVIYVAINAMPFSSGEKVYVKGYTCNVDEYRYGYFDAYRGRMQYSTLDRKDFSNTIHFILP